MQNRPRLKQSHLQTRHQFRVCRGYAPETAQSKVTSAKNAHKCLQTLVILRSTPGTHRYIAGVTPGPHRPVAGRGRKAERRMKNAECRKQKVISASQVPNNQMVTRSKRTHCRRSNGATSERVTGDSPVLRGRRVRMRAGGLQNAVAPPVMCITRRVVNPIPQPATSRVMAFMRMSCSLRCCARNYPTSGLI